MYIQGLDHWVNIECTAAASTLIWRGHSFSLTMVWWVHVLTFLPMGLHAMDLAVDLGTLEQNMEKAK